MKLCNSFRPFSPACPRASNPSSLSASAPSSSPRRGSASKGQWPSTTKTTEGRRRRRRTTDDNRTRTYETCPDGTITRTTSGTSTPSSSLIRPPLNKNCCLIIGLVNINIDDINMGKSRKEEPEEPTYEFILPSDIIIQHH